MSVEWLMPALSTCKLSHQVEDTMQDNQVHFKNLQEENNSNGYEFYRSDSLDAFLESDTAESDHAINNHVNFDSSRRGTENTFPDIFLSVF